MSNEEFDRRIDRLTERHEALAQTVELFVAESREWCAKVEPLIVTLEDAMTRLAKITGNHEQPGRSS